MRGVSESRREKIEFRRGFIIEQMAKGVTPMTLTKQLGVSRATITTDIQALRKQVTNDIRDFPKQVSYQHKLLESNANQAIARLWSILDNADLDPKTTCNVLATLATYLALKRDLLEDTAAISEILETVIEAEANEKYRQQEQEQQRINPLYPELDKREPVF